MNSRNKSALKAKPPPLPKGKPSPSAAAVPLPKPKVLAYSASKPITLATPKSKPNATKKTAAIPATNNAQVSPAPSSSAGAKDPTIALLISLLAMFILSSGAGYIYLGEKRKGAICIIAVWSIALAFSFAIFFGILLVNVLMLLCPIPALLFIILVQLFICYDVFNVAKGEKSMLPF